MSEVAIRQQGSALAVTTGDEFWNEKQIAALRQLGVESATNGDLAVFHHVCQRTGLDPFARQIYMIKRDGKQTIQTGIDGFRLVARRSVDAAGETLSIGASEWYDPETKTWVDVWLSEDPPAAARVTVLRNGHAFPGVALWREYVQIAKDKQGVEYVTKMWRTRPAGQLAKCAEALALRKAFPQDLSGVYTDDEMAREYTAARPVRQASITAEEIAGEVVEGEVADDDYRPGGSPASKLAEEQVQDVELPEPDISVNDPALDLERGMS